MSIVINSVGGSKPPEIQNKPAVTPTKSQQVIKPDAGYDGLGPVTVKPIPDHYADVSYDTVTEKTLLDGETAHDSSGTSIYGGMEKATFTSTGTGNRLIDSNGLTYDSNPNLWYLSDRLPGATARWFTDRNGNRTRVYARLPFQASQTDYVAIASGVLPDGEPGMCVEIDAPDLVPGNIKSGVNILGVRGTAKAQTVDLSKDTVSEGTMIEGTTAHNSAEQPIAGIIPLAAQTTAREMGPSHPGKIYRADNKAEIPTTSDRPLHYLPADSNKPQLYQHIPLAMTPDGSSIPEHHTIYIPLKTPSVSEYLAVTKQGQPSDLGKQIYVSVSSATLMPSNIKQGVKIFGIEGSMAGNDKPVREMTIDLNSTETPQTFVPEGFLANSIKVNVNIPGSDLEAHTATVTGGKIKANFTMKSGPLGVWGAAKGQGSSWQSPTYAFRGNKYQQIGIGTSGQEQTMTLSLEADGTVNGLPTLTSGTLLVVRGNVQ